jgi:hypothetical protein
VLLDSSVPWDFAVPAGAEVFRFTAWDGSSKADWLLPAPSFAEELSDVPTAPRYGMVIDLDRCTGACMVACAAENNVPPLPSKATPRTGITPMLVHKVSNGVEGATQREVFIPVTCMQCDKETPCVSSEGGPYRTQALLVIS